MRKRRLAQLPFIVAMALLNGCAGLNSSGQSVAPPLVDYPRAFQARAAQELEALLRARFMLRSRAAPHWPGSLRTTESLGADRTQVLTSAPARNQRL